MRRSEKELSALPELEAIIAKARVLHLGLARGGEPYVVPVHFGYRRGAFFFHSAPAGMKLDWLRENPRVCFTLEVDVRLTPSDAACGWGCAYRSVIGFGKAILVTDEVQKRVGLDLIMRQCGATGPFTYAEKTLDRTAVVRIDIETMTGKASGA